MKSIDYTLPILNNSYPNVANSKRETVVSVVKNDSYPKDIVQLNNDSIKYGMRVSAEKLVEFKYSPYDRKVSAEIIDNEKHIKVLDENLPKELREINDPKVFSAFLKNTYARVSTLSDGSTKVDLNRKLLGGMPKHTDQEVDKKVASVKKEASETYGDRPVSSSDIQDLNYLTRQEVYKQGVNAPNNVIIINVQNNYEQKKGGCC